MKNIFLSLALLVGINCTSTNNNNNNMEDGIYANIKTNKGEIVLKLEFEKTPLTAANFIALAEGKMKNKKKGLGTPYYDGLKFHRVIADFMIQGGDFENHDGTGGYASAWFGVCNGDINVNQSDCPNQESWNVPDEAYNGLTHLPCTISMAKTSFPNSGGSQFFLMPDDIYKHTWLDGVHTVFGVITDGCEHVTEISEVATGQNDIPIMPVMIYNATAMD